mmetsp:Transcript_7074/g.20643  ORF Transcript_7074/g.20643 Transcript_7074/m.20643 type:complete len:218 (-) Transcript_7074:83-736(-)
MLSLGDTLGFATLTVFTVVSLCGMPARTLDSSMSTHPGRSQVPSPTRTMFWKSRALSSGFSWPKMLATIAESIPGSSVEGLDISRDSLCSGRCIFFDAVRNLSSLCTRASNMSSSTESPNGELWSAEVAVWSSHLLLFSSADRPKAFGKYSPMGAMNLSLPRPTSTLWDPPDPCPSLKTTLVLFVTLGELSALPTPLLPGPPLALTSSSVSYLQHSE